VTIAVEPDRVLLGWFISSQRRGTHEIHRFRSMNSRRAAYL